MFWTILALVLMVVLGGFISYYGDLQGRRWGKRRVSWFGLRPKYTAIVITSLTGGFIALMSILTVLIASPTVREVLLRGERAIEDNKRLNISLNIERKMAARELENYKSQTVENQTKLAASDLKLHASNLKVEAAQMKFAPMQAELATLEKTQATLQATLRREQADIQQKLAELRAIKAQNTRAKVANADLAGQISNLEQQKTQLAAWNHQLEEGNKELQKRNENVTRLIAASSKELAELTHNNGALMEANKHLVSQNEELENSSRDRQRELTRKQTELDRVNGQLARAKTELDQAYSQMAGAGKTFVQNYHAVRQGEINIRVGSELARRVLTGNLNSGAVRKQMVQLLEEASDTAGVYGAMRGENNRAVRIISKRLITPFDSQDANEDDSLNALSETLAETLAKNHAPVVVVATSLNNCVRGEQALVELHPFPINHIFDKGEVVASRLIDAGQSPERVKNAIADFLQQDVKMAAVRAGSIPRVDPTTGIKEVGVFDSIALGQLADHVKRMGGNVLLKAVAIAPTTSADPLDSAHLRLETASAPQGSSPSPPRLSLKGF